MLQEIRAHDEQVMSKWHDEFAFEVVVRKKGKMHTSSMPASWPINLVVRNDLSEFWTSVLPMGMPSTPPNDRKRYETEKEW